MTERYKIGDIDNECFYQMPKSLFTNPKYKPITTTAKIIYAILKDRMGLSRQNGWADENGDIYLLFSQESLAEYLGVASKTVHRGMKELNEVGLIDSIRQGLGKANKIYIKKPMMSVQDMTKMSSLNMTKMSGQSGQKCPPNNTEYNNTVCNNTENDIGHTDGLTDEMSDLIKFCNDNVEILTPFKMQMLEGYVDDYGIEWVQRGLEKVAGMDRTKQNVKYLGGVLNGWKKDGVPKPWEDSKEAKQTTKIMHDDIGEYELIDGYKVYL